MGAGVKWMMGGLGGSCTLPMKWPSSMISSAARSVPKVCCVSFGMLYDEPACATGEGGSELRQA